MSTPTTLINQEDIEKEDTGRNIDWQNEESINFENNKRYSLVRKGYLYDEVEGE